MSNLKLVTDKGKTGQDIFNERLKEIGVSERNSIIWEYLSQGMTQTEVAKRLNISHVTVSTAIKKTLEQVREYALKDAEDWRHRQLLILDKQIELAFSDSAIQAEAVLGEDGEQVISAGGMPRWILSPLEAAKIRNMGANRLIRALETQAKLLNLLVDRHEVDVRQVTVSYLRGDKELIEGL